jgi:hypothetical protein
MKDRMFFMRAQPLHRVGRGVGSQRQAMPSTVFSPGSGWRARTWEKLAATIITRWPRRTHSRAR